MKQKRRNSKLNALLNSLIAVFFLLCILLLLYPYVSNLFIGAAQRETFFSYDSRTSQMTDEEKEALIAAALRYNKRLSEAPVGYDFDDAVTEEYMSLLDLGDNGLMGTLEIPCIKLKLPVYHTVNEEILQIGVGHVQGSSLPVEGCSIISTDLKQAIHFKSRCWTRFLITALEKSKPSNRTMLRKSESPKGSSSAHL